MNTNDVQLPPLPAGYAPEVAAAMRNYARAAIEVDRKRRGEPVGYIMPTALKQLKAGGNAIVGGVSQGCDVPIYTAPQPAEPVEKPYPVKLHAWGGATRYHDYEMSDGSIQTLKDTEAKELGWGRKPAEPVRVPSEDQWGTLALWLDRRREYPTVMITGEVAGDIADLLAHHNSVP